MIELQGLTKRYSDGTVALADATLSVPQGEFLVLLGRSGAGKSTLLRCLNRLVDPTSGSITINGTRVERLRGRPLRDLRRRVGMIFQEFHLVKRKRVLDNVLHGRLGHKQGLAGTIGLFSNDEKRLAYDILVRLGLEDQAFKRADQLSGGQKQRVAIARALMQEPLVMLADEPVASLDPAASENVLGYLKRICKEEDITAVVSLHQVEYARAFADRIVALNAGRIIFDGDPGTLDEDTVARLYFAETDAQEQAA